MESALEVLRAEIALTRIGSMDPILDLQRNLHNQQSMYQDWLEARARLASLQVRLSRAERELQRLEGLRKNQFISESVYDATRTEYLALKAEEEEVVQLVATLERFVQDSNLSADNGESMLDETLLATLQWQEARLRQLESELQPWALRAPISGILTLLDPTTVSRIRRTGEFVREGDSLLRIRAQQPDYIIGYARMPLRTIPTEGAEIEVIRRDTRRLSGSAEILKVGPHFEALGPAFQRPFGDPEERALPFLVSLPPGLDLRPGEVVDLHLRQ
ncbi:MAG: hypothetical protein JJU20_02545 [Opitutales bacterium]|nr:hypothetical protein [Opitutales bacterium]